MAYRRAGGTLNEKSIAAAKRSKQIRLELARRDPNAFMPLVLRDEETNQPVHQAPYHTDWQDLITSNPRLVLWSHVESGKTQQISIGRVLWELGADPTLRIVIVAATGTQAVKITKSIGQYIRNSAELKMIFPELRPAKASASGTKMAGWTQESITVERKTQAKDPSVQATCLHGNILGARIDLLIIDDLLTYETTRTEYMRQDTLHWIESTLLGRLTRRGRVIFIGNAWHNEDAMHVLGRRGYWAAHKFPALDAENNQSNWDERWPMDRLSEKQEELGPLEFARQMQCEARAEGEARFRRQDIDKCLARGVGEMLMARVDTMPNRARTFTGVDLGVKRKAGSHLSVMFTVMVHENNDRQGINIESGRWTAQELLDRLADTQRRYDSLLVVENNAAQDFIVQFAIDRNLVVQPHTTGSNKAHPLYGVESLAAEMARGQWIIPCDEDGNVHTEVQSWLDEMLYYDPSGHTGDRLMASWFAREGARGSHGMHRVDSAVLGGDNGVHIPKKKIRDDGYASYEREAQAVHNRGIWDGLMSEFD